jgi:hypothetical protein
MSDMNHYEDALASGGIPTVGRDASSLEEAEEDDDEDDIADAVNIRQATVVVTPRDAAPLDNTILPPDRLTFGIPAPVARNTLGLTQDPRPMTLDQNEQNAAETSLPASSSEPGDAAGIAATNLLYQSLSLTDKGSALHDAIRSALGFHEAWLRNQMSQASKEPATVITEALLRSLKKTSISDDEDEAGDTFEVRTNKNLIRRRKNLRLIEKKKQEGEAKDSVAAPSDPLPLNRRLHNHHDFLALQMFLMDIEDQVVRKDWSSPIEMWVFRQIEKGSKAHTAFNVFLKSGQGPQLQSNKCYFADFRDFKETILRTFFTKLRDPIAVIESNIKRIKLTLSGVDGPTTPTTLEGFCNTLRFLFNQAPLEAQYPERQQVSRIRERLPKQVETYLLEWEVNNSQLINSFESLMPCLHRQDVLFSDSRESKIPNPPPTKRLATDAALQVAEVVKGPKRPRGIDNRPPCAFCHKPGHLAENCWGKFPEKRRSYNERGRRPNAPPLPLNNITTASLQAMISQAVENVIASVKNP